MNLRDRVENIPPLLSRNRKSIQTDDSDMKVLHGARTPGRQLLRFSRLEVTGSLSQIWILSLTPSILLAERKFFNCKPSKQIIQ